MHIDEYDFGKIRVDGKEYQNDMIILPDHVYSNWWRRRGHEFHPDDLSKIIEARPDLLIVGKGYYGRMRVLDETKKKIEEIGCELVAEKTEAACSLYNERESEGRVVAALHLTC
jgi:hypothetical protein